VIDFFRRLLSPYAKLGLALQAAIVIGIIALTTAFGVAVVISIPPDHFSSKRPVTESWWDKDPLLRATVLTLKNALGGILAVLGFIMALPLVPGPGLVFILIGVSLIDFPGKRKAERRLLAVPSVTRFLNEVRARFGRAPLVLDDPEHRDQPPRAGA
jgi:hypothetical protein